MTNTTELSDNSSNESQMYNIGLTSQTAPTCFNLHKKIDTWVAGYRNSGFTLKSLAATDSSAIKKTRLSRRQKRAKPKIESSSVYEIKFITGKKCIHESRSRVDLSIHGHNYTLLLLQDPNTVLAWFILDLDSAEMWPGNLRLFTQQVFDELLHRTY